MKKICILLAMLACMLAAAAADAAEVLDVRWTTNKYNIAWFEVEVTDLVPYSVSMEGTRLVLTVNAPLVSGKSFNSNSFPVAQSVADHFTPSSSGGKTTVDVTLTREITKKEYRVYTIKKNQRSNRPARIVLELTADKKSSASADEYSHFLPATASTELSGTWYDEYGKEACSIDTGSINFRENGITYKILGIGRREVPEKQPDGRIIGVNRSFLMLDNNGSETERGISYVLGTKGHIKFLILENYPTALQRRSGPVEHLESIGGIYLGMPRRLAEKICGAPDSTYDDHGVVAAYYESAGLDIRYSGNRVDEIILHRGSPFTFDKSGLGCDSPLDRFAWNYNITRPIEKVDLDNFKPAAGYPLKDGSEYIYFVSNGDIILTAEDSWG